MAFFLHKKLVIISCIMSFYRNSLPVACARHRSLHLQKSVLGNGSTIFQSQTPYIPFHLPLQRAKSILCSQRVAPGKGRSLRKPKICRHRKTGGQLQYIPCPLQLLHSFYRQKKSTDSKTGLPICCTGYITLFRQGNAALKCRCGKFVFLQFSDALPSVAKAMEGILRTLRYTPLIFAGKKNLRIANLSACHP